MPFTPLWALDNISLWRKGAGVNGSLPYLNRATGWRGDLIAREVLFERDLKRARLSCAKALLAQLEPNMAEMNDADILTNIAKVPPKLAARTLLRLAGKNNRADQILGYVYMHAVKGDDAASAEIAKCLSAAVENLLVNGDEEIADVMGLDLSFLKKGLANVVSAASSTVSSPAAGSLLSLIPGVGPFLPSIVKTGANLLSAANKGNPEAVKKVQNVIAVAKTGDPKATEALAALKAANSLAQKSISIPAPPAPVAKPPKIISPVSPSVVLRPAKPSDIQRSSNGIYIPSWTDVNGKAIRAAATGVLLDMRQKGIDFRAYGNTSAQTMRGLQPMVEEELRSRGAMPTENKINPSQGQKWWQGNLKAIDRVF